MVRQRLLKLDGMNMMQTAHMDLLDLYLPETCPPPVSCAKAIFDEFAEGTDEMVVWRKVLAGNKDGQKNLVALERFGRWNFLPVLWRKLWWW